MNVQIPVSASESGSASPLVGIDPCKTHACLIDSS
jgi:hypothetical protein